MKHLAGPLTLIGVVLVVGSFPSTVVAKAPPVDKCSNLKGVQHSIPAGYKRGSGQRCIRKPKTVTVKPPPPKPTLITWWPNGYAPWTGSGSGAPDSHGEPLVAYQPASCTTNGGTQIPNGASDSSGNICWAYDLVVNVLFSDGTTGCPFLYISVNEISNGVIVGGVNDIQNGVPNGQPVLMHGIVYPEGQPNITLQPTEIDCDSA